MPLSLHDATIPSTLQILRALDAVLGKAAAHCKAEGIDEATLVEARLAPDMLPLGYQVKSCVVHSLGAIEGTRAGRFSPDQSPWPGDFAGLRARVGETIAALEAIDPGGHEALAAAETEFRSASFVLPFTGTDFLLSFSQPNFYFHAVIAYAILRAQGVEIGKRDFLGTPRIKR